MIHFRPGAENGFLLKFPIEIIDVYNKKIVNIHPALLPKYGGKGMYGMNVHKAIIKNKEAVSGITIHYVNKKYDEGPIILQENVYVLSKITKPYYRQSSKKKFRFF